jgi:hypothetical protein
LSPLQARTIARAPLASGAAARLELLEFFLVHADDIVRCAQASVDWLARYAGVRQSACLAVDAESNMLVGIAGAGVAADDIELFSWPLSDVRDPLVGALTAVQPVTFKPARPNGHASRALPLTPLGTAAFMAVPLRGTRETSGDEGALGLLLVRA